MKAVLDADGRDSVESKVVAGWDDGPPLRFRPDIWLAVSNPRDEPQVEPRERVGSREARKRLRWEIKKYQEKLCDLAAEIDKAEQHRAATASALGYLASVQRDGMPDVPPAEAPVPDTEASSVLPPESGIYFMWRGGDVVYVGQSVSLRSRVTQRHDRAPDAEWCSWILVPRPELNYAECFYIWRLRPRLNFSGRSMRADREALAPGSTEGK